MVGLLAPLTATAIGLVLSHAVGLPIPLIVIATLLAAVLGGVLTLNLLYMPDRPTIDDWQATAARSANALGEEIETLIATLARLQSELDELQRRPETDA